MKSILKALFVAALAGTFVGALLRRLAAQSPRDVPTLKPVSDSEPLLEEPLQESALHVAQNSPL